MGKQRKVYIISSGVTKFAKAHPDMDFRLMVKKAFDYAMKDVSNLQLKDIDGSRISYFSDHFARAMNSFPFHVSTLDIVSNPATRQTSILPLAIVSQPDWIA